MHSRKGIAVQSLSRVQLFAALWTAAHQAPLSFTISETSPRVMSVSQWCYLTTSSSSALFSSCPQSFLTSGSLPMSPLFASGGQSIGASASASDLPMNIEDFFPLRLTGLTSWHSQGTLRSLLQHHHVFFRDHNPTPKYPPSHMVSGVQVQGTRWPRILPSLKVDSSLLPDLARG